ncbi:MAG: ATP-binding protein, partial [Candidatus Omnitrophica bacterium]|nr:ATP-binding protein [Candidatus Omnitrophota bacterium]
MRLPQPGTMVPPSEAFEPILLNGIRLDPQNPLRLEFLVAQNNDDHFSNHKDQLDRLVRYFLASLTTPEEDLWVNLSPNEKDRIITKDFSTTEMGRDMLAQDYLLKQITASLMYPEDEIGKDFWEKVYREAQNTYGTTSIPVNTFNKVWIVPEHAVVHEDGNLALILESHLKVMLEEDYLSLEKNVLTKNGVSPSQPSSRKINQISSNVVREVIIPILEREVNQGKHFSQLRQIYHSLILAVWFKQRMQNSLLGKMYVDQRKMGGIHLQDRGIDQKIYQKYLEAFEKGVFNYIREDVDPATQQTIPRKYFSGGVGAQAAYHTTEIVHDPARADQQGKADEVVRYDLTPKRGDDEAFLAEEPRNLIFSDQAEAVDQELHRRAKIDDTRYLRVVLRDQEDLERLKIRIRISEGRIIVEDGELLEVIKNGGWLMVDYDQSNPKLVAGLNSLFDKSPYFETFQASGDLKIVGVLNPKNIWNYSVDFYSRFPEKEQAEDLVLEDPLRQIEEWSTTEDFAGEAIEMFESPFVYEELIGRYVFTPQGPVAQEGVLTHALRTGRPLLISGANWQDPKLTGLLRDILKRGELEFNGERIAVPDGFRIYQRAIDYKQRVENKRLILPAESKSTGEVWVVNRLTQDDLFGFTQIQEDGRVVERPGILDGPDATIEAPLRLHITSPLDAWVWHKMMHTNRPIEIAVDPGVVVPEVYREFRSEQQKKALPQKRIKKWDDVKKEKVVLIEGQDLGFVAQRLQDDLDQEDLVFVAMDAETNLKDFLESIDVTATLADGTRQFASTPLEIFKALQQGKTVVFQGADANESLAWELQTLLGRDPYLVVNGVRHNLRDLSGQVIVTRRPQVGRAFYAENHVEMEPTDEELKAILSREFADRFNEENFRALLAIRNLFATIPPPPTANLYPATPNFDLQRLRLLYRHNNWLEAFENVFISRYVWAPEVAAFMRVMVKKSFNVEEEGRAKNSIHGRRLNAVLNKVVPPVGWTQHFWEFVDTLSTDRLAELDLGQTFTQINTPGVFDLIHKALVKKYQGTEREEFYRYRFQIEKAEDLGSAPTIDDKTHVGERTWAEQTTRAIRALKASPGVMFQGPPGTGKTFLAAQIRNELGYQENEVFHLTTGADTKIRDIVVDKPMLDGKTTTEDEIIARWAKRKEGGLLNVDEANLTPEEFWNFLKGLFATKPHIWINGEKVILTQRHKVIFTGNQDFMEGRKIQNIVAEEMITIPFSHFDDEFLGERIREYLSTAKQRPQELQILLLTLHRFFERMGNYDDLSLRDVQELADRVNLLVEAQWKEEDVVLVAWDIYKGRYTEEEQIAFKYLLMEKFGVSIDEYQGNVARQVRGQQADFDRHDVVLVDSTTDSVHLINEFLAVRQARLDGRSVIQGKRG